VASSVKSVWAKARAKLSSSTSSSTHTTGTSSTDSGIAQTSLTSRNSASRLRHSSQDVLTTHSKDGTTLRPIAELWDEAFNELRDDSESLVKEFDVILSKTVAGGIATGQVPVVAFSGLGKVQRRQQMEILLKQKIKDVEEGSWKLRFKDHQFLVTDLVKPVVAVIEWAKEYVGSALETSPYGSLAWAGVCLLLPVSVPQPGLDRILTC
jgi:N-terminal domain of NWD NACHT-NTPase